MATLKVKFRPSARKGSMGMVVYQVIHRRVVRQVKTKYRVFPSEWNNEDGCILCPTLYDIKSSNTERNTKNANAERCAELMSMRRKMMVDQEKLKCLIRTHDNSDESYTVDDIIKDFVNWKDQCYDDGFVAFCEKLILRYIALGKRSAAEKLRTTLNSFLRFLDSADVSMVDVNSFLIEHYDTYMKGKRLERNTRSFYLRTLRAAYNTAVDEGFTIQQYPFRKVRTGIYKTVKRALTFCEMQRVKRMTFVGRPRYEEARDIFMLSFYMRGISLVDLAYLRKSDLRYGVISYHRHKTGQLLSMRWEPDMDELKKRLWALSDLPEEKSPFLLPIIKIRKAKDAEDTDKVRILYLNAYHLINTKLHTIGEELSLPLVLTSYVARHSWASIAKNKNIPISIISECLGHDNEKTTQIYLASFDTRVLDEANRKVWKDL